MRTARTMAVGGGDWEKYITIEIWMKRKWFTIYICTMTYWNLNKEQLIDIIKGNGAKGEI